MMKEPLFKQYVGLVTRWVRDEFLIAWIRLVAIYVVTSGILLSALSFVIYVAVKGNLISTIGNSILNPFTQELILIEALDALKERIITADILMLVIVVVVGMMLSYRTLQPIKKSMQEQKRFIADASHELRTPLAILKLDLELLLRNKELHSDSLKNIVSGLHEEVDSVVELTNSLLNLSKSVNNSDNMENSEMTELISTIAYNVQKLYQEKNISLTVEQQGEFSQYISSVDIKRIFTNIIKNAFQYTQNNGSISVVISQKNNKTHCIIKDTGVGIQKENIKKVFEPFYQEDLSRNHEGAGLGLSMVKKLVEKHYGNIEISSEIKKGTVVTVTI